MSLQGTIGSLLRQEGNGAFEIVVVDNNSSDDTPSVIEAAAAQDARVRYLFEGKQGVSHGRNAGINAARAPVIAFTDDDVVPSTDWLAQTLRALADHPDCGCVGGRVLPLWPYDPPAWLTPRHWSPLALVDFGDAQMIDAANRKCLVTANMSARRSVFDQVGFFTPAFQKTIGSTCSIEDRELQERYWRAGGRGWFDPKIVVHAEVQGERLSKSYHRRWHRSHGQLHAMLGDPDMEASSFRVLGVPGHIVRGLGAKSLAALTAAMRGDDANAFEHEIEARFYGGFARYRVFHTRKGH